MPTKTLFLKTLAVLTSALLLFISGCGKSNTLALSGTVESVQIDANAETAGKVIKLEKDEGDTVKKDDVLAVVDSSAQELAVKQQEAVVKLKQARLDELKAGSRAEQVQQAEAAVKAAKAKLDELKAGSRPEQIKQAEAAVETAKTSVNNAQNAVDTAEIGYNYWLDKYNKTLSLSGSSAVSENDLADAKYKVDTANQQLLTAREQLKSAQSQLKSAQSQLDLLKNGATSQSIEAAQANYDQSVAQLDLLKKGSTAQSIQAAEADLEQSRAALDQAKLTLSKCQIKAPVDGTYLLRNVNVGDMVNIGTSVGTLSDLTNLEVKVYIPQRNLHSVSLNQELNLKAISLPGKTIRGKVVYIASEAEFTPKNTETSEAKENTVFKLKIKILDNIQSLKPGMTVTAYIP